MNWRVFSFVIAFLVVVPLIVTLVVLKRKSESFSLNPVDAIFKGVVKSNKQKAQWTKIPAEWATIIGEYAKYNKADGEILTAALKRGASVYKGGWIMDVQKNAFAMTLDTTIFYTKNSGKYNLSTHVHELVHVYQYGKYGVTKFLGNYFGENAYKIVKAWLTKTENNVMKGSKYETQAYDLTARFKAWYSSTHAGSSASNIEVDVTP